MCSNCKCSHGREIFFNPRRSYTRLLTGGSVYNAVCFAFICNQINCFLFVTFVTNTFVTNTFCHFFTVPSAPAGEHTNRDRSPPATTTLPLQLPATQQRGPWQCGECGRKNGSRYHVLNGTAGYAPNTKAFVRRARKPTSLRVFVLRTSPGATKKRPRSCSNRDWRTRSCSRPRPSRFCGTRGGSSGGGSEEEAAPAPAAAEDMDMGVRRPSSSGRWARTLAATPTALPASSMPASRSPRRRRSGAAHLALYRYKRAHPGDTDAAMLEDALESAKRVCRRTDGTPAQPFRDIRPVAGEL